jgi:putative polymerase
MTAVTDRREALPGSLRDRLHDTASMWLVIAALTFNAILCFANTVLFPISDVMVIGSEFVIISMTMLFALDRRIEPYLILAILISYALLIMAMRPMFDPKAVRDFMIPVGFYCLGRRRPSVALADRVVMACGLIVVAFGLFEYCAFDTFEKYFNIIRYYVARGTVAPADVSGQTGTLFASGLRPDARTLLPFLGMHRVSSVFLEPVSAGNFGAILYVWALCRPGMRGRAVVFGCAAVIIVLADARFGAYTCAASTVAALGFYRVPRVFWFCLPLAMMCMLAIYGFESMQVDWTNDISGRLLWTARLLTSLSLDGAMGVSAQKPFLSDSGYAYSINEVGVLGFTVFWALFVFSAPADRAAWRLRACAATYFCLLLVISDSPYSIKTAALFWFMLGSVDGAASVSRVSAREEPAWRPAPQAMPAR